MQYNPKEAESTNVQLADGIYDAECIEAKDDVSKAGNEMLVLNWKVFGNKGETVRVRDYIVSTAQWKLKQAMEGCGIAVDAERAVDAADFEGKSARVSVVKDGEYNKIKAYVAAAAKVELDDEIGF